jgi:hypothetical protein
MRHVAAEQLTKRLQALVGFAAGYCQQGLDGGFQAFYGSRGTGKKKSGRGAAGF